MDYNIYRKKKQEKEELSMSEKYLLSQKNYEKFLGKKSFQIENVYREKSDSKMNFLYRHNEKGYKVWGVPFLYSLS